MTVSCETIIPPSPRYSAVRASCPKAAMPFVTACAKLTGTISLGLLTVPPLAYWLINRQGSLATTSLITVPAVVNIASNENATESWQLIQQRVDMMTVLCGTVSTASFALAFCVGRRHPYLLYTSAIAALLLRNQRQTLRSLGNWLKDEYHLAKEFVRENTAHKSRRRASNSRANKPSNRATVQGVQSQPQLPPEQLTLALEKLGASSLTNCLVSGIAFTLATIGVFGDMD